MATTDTDTSDHQPFDKIINFRDIGTFINEATGRQLLKPSSVFRSARPDAATANDRARLTNDYNIKTIIDLRTPTEHVQARRKYASQIPAAPTVTPSDPKKPMRIPGIEWLYVCPAQPFVETPKGSLRHYVLLYPTLSLLYSILPTIGNISSFLRFLDYLLSVHANPNLLDRDVDFNGKAYSDSLLKQLSWRQTAKLYALYVCGYRVEAIRILGENVMAPQGLVALTEATLECSRKEVAEVCAILSDFNSYPVLVHCTQGKDRTGLTVLLVLMLCGVPVEAIEKDYLASQKELENEREERLKEIKEIGLPDSFADCPEDWVRTVVGWINEKYGGIEAYLEGCGVRKQSMEKVKQILLQS